MSAAGSPTRVFDGPHPAERRAVPGAHPGRTGGVSFVALLLTAFREAWGADPDLAVFDDGAISYKGFEHGSFELVTKEVVPRHIFVDDPGQTVVLHRSGSSVAVSSLANGAARMEDLQSQQQDVLANYSREHGPGSSTPPGEAPDPDPQPIDLRPPDGPTLQPIPAVLPFPSTAVPDAPPPVRAPPTLTLGAGVVEVDTVRFDEFSASAGSFSATSSGSGTPPVFGIAGGTSDPVTIDGVRYDVEKVGTFGVLHVDSATGAYLYVPNNEAINALKAPSTDSFVIVASDGHASASQTFSIAIDGTDDAAFVSGAVTGAVTAAVHPALAHSPLPAAVAGLPTASGVLTAADVDDPADTFSAVGTARASDYGYGSFTIAADGHWTYTLDPDNSAVLALTSRQTTTDTFTVTTIGGTPQVVTVTIRGADDPAAIAGDLHGLLIEAGGVRNSDPGIPVACGTLTATDVDGPSDTFQAVSCPQASENGFGLFTMTADGHWTYALDQCAPAVEALNAGQRLTDSFTVRADDGTAQTVAVAIEGANDAAVVCGDTHGFLSVSRDPCGPPPSVSGRLTDRDVDDADDTFAATTCPQASENGFGSFTMSACGTWTYTLDPDNPDVAALGPCDVVTDRFTVTTVDGTPQVVTVTIHGAGDADRPFRFADAAPSVSEQVDPAPVLHDVPEAGGWLFAECGQAPHDFMPQAIPPAAMHHDLIA